MELRGKNILITGTTRGIGLATALLLGKKKCNVFVWNRVMPQLPDKVDVLINNAGIYFTSPFEHTSLLDWEKAFETNVTLPFVLIKTLLRENRFNPEFSVILNVNSWDIERHPVQQIAYNCSKAALHELTLSLGRELYIRHILVTEIVLPTVRTDMLLKVNKANPLPKKIISMREAARRIWQLLRQI